MSFCIGYTYFMSKEFIYSIQAHFAVLMVFDLTSKMIMG